jgi:hypothetical protein
MPSDWPPGQRMIRDALYQDEDHSPDTFTPKISRALFVDLAVGCLYNQMACVEMERTRSLAASTPP